MIILEHETIYCNAYRVGDVRTSGIDLHGPYVRTVIGIERRSPIEVWNGQSNVYCPVYRVTSEIEYLNS